MKLVREAEASLAETYHAIWDSLQPGDVFECCFGGELERFRVEKVLPTGERVCKILTFPPMCGVIVNRSGSRVGYVRYLGYAVERRFLWWRWHTIRYTDGV